VRPSTAAQGGGQMAPRVVAHRQASSKGVIIRTRRAVSRASPCASPHGPSPLSCAHPTTSCRGESAACRPTVSNPHPFGDGLDGWNCVRRRHCGNLVRTQPSCPRIRAAQSASSIAGELTQRLPVWAASIKLVIAQSSQCHGPAIVLARPADPRLAQRIQNQPSTRRAAGAHRGPHASPAGGQPAGRFRRLRPSARRTQRPASA
jgi:hypothetical protein